MTETVTLVYMERERRRDTECALSLYLSVEDDTRYNYNRLHAIYDYTMIRYLIRTI